ncbi:hypothetical protein [Pseudogracilibacillus sp. SO30301A]|uniref:hypothetical protein n=1 Tax=Pseudogracilibacillus sp. SO30301A TaxID=3098291 RepID=UPI00300E12DB
MGKKTLLKLEQEKVGEESTSLFKQKSFLLVWIATLFTGLATSFFYWLNLGMWFAIWVWQSHYQLF